MSKWYIRFMLIVVFVVLWFLPVLVRGSNSVQTGPEQDYTITPLVYWQQDAGYSTQMIFYLT